MVKAGQILDKVAPFAEGDFISSVARNAYSTILSHRRFFH